MNLREGLHNIMLIEYTLSASTLRAYKLRLGN
jgi:hypothetical protein